MTALGVTGFGSSFLNAASPVVLLGVLALPGCGGGQGKVRTAESASCPPGQSFDGEFCQVDQAVATAETDSVPAEEVEKSQPKQAKSEQDSTVKPETPSDTKSSEGTPGLTEPVAPEGPIDEEATAEGAAETTEPSFAAPIDYAMAAQAAPVMHYLASSHLPSGARPLGSAFAGQFATGQVLEQKIQLQAGRCYTVVALGLPPVKEVTLELFGADEDSPVAREEMRGPQAVLGSRNSCYKAKESGPVKLVVSVTEGQGLAAAQVFQK